MFNESVLKLGRGDYYAPLVTWATFTHFRGKSRKYAHQLLGGTNG